MQIVKPYAKMLGIGSRDEGIELLRLVEWIGCISHRSEEAQTEDSWERFITSVVLGHGDWSITEYASVTVDAVVDRGITHEWVRHRIGAYTQESTWFNNLEKGGLLRGVIPFTRIFVTYSLRMWRHLFLMRTTKESHPQMREVTISLLEEFKAKIPLLYDDIEPLAKQSDNLRKAQ